MEVQEIKTLATDIAPKRYKCDGDFIKVETVPSGNPLYIKTSENETALLVAGRSEKFEKPFNWIEITGFVAGELLTLQTGLGWMLDSIPAEIAGTVEITGPITSGVGNALLRFIQHNSIENDIQTGAVVESNLRAEDALNGDSVPLSSIDISVDNPAWGGTLATAALQYQEGSNGSIHRVYQADLFAVAADGDALAPAAGKSLRILWIDYYGANGNCNLTGSTMGVVPGSVVLLGASTIINKRRDFSNVGILFAPDETVTVTAPSGGCSFGYVEA